MTFQEALAELGIDDDAGPDQARRAYLRLLKTRKPETDPQGFMRLREAYDLVKPRLEWRDTLLRARAAAPEPAAIPEPEPVAEAPHEEDAAAPEPHDDEPHDDEPHDDEPHDDDEAELPEREPVTVDALLAAGQHERAAGELAALFDHAVERSQDATPAVSKALRLILTLYAKGSPVAAAALGASLFEYLRASGQEARAIRGADAARWTLLRELATLSPSFPDVVRAAVARAALGGDLGDANRELAAWQQRRPGPAAEAALILRRQAPVIAAAVADTLDPPEPRASRRTAPATSDRSGWAFGVMALFALRLLMLLGRTVSTPSYEPSHYTPPSHDPATLEAPRGNTPLDQLRERALHRADRMKAHADYALGSDGGRPLVRYEVVSENAQAVAGSIRQGDCFMARLTMVAIKEPFDPHGGVSADEIGRVEASTLDQALAAYCTALDASRAAGAAP